MKIIFWGTPNFAIPTLNAILESEHELLAVVTQPDRRRGRGKETTPSAIKKRAIEYGIKIFTPNNIKQQKEIQEQIASLSADIYIVVAFGQILPLEVLKQPPLGCWNCHASLLPRWRGAGPIQWSLLSGDSKTGVGIMSMEQGLDTGPILLSRDVNIGLSDNFQILSEKLSLISSELMLEALVIIRDHAKQSLKLVSQDEIKEEIKYARLIQKEDLLIDWNQRTINIHQKVMGLFPNAYTFCKGKRLKILNSFPMADEYSNEMTHDQKCLYRRLVNVRTTPGEIVQVEDEMGIVVSTADSFILLDKVKLEGKSMVQNKQISQQLKPNIGDLLG